MRMIQSTGELPYEEKLNSIHYPERDTPEGRNMAKSYGEGESRHEVLQQTEEGAAFRNKQKCQI